MIHNFIKSNNLKSISIQQLFELWESKTIKNSYKIKYEAHIFIIP